MVVGKNDYYFINANNSVPENVLFHSSETNNDYSIFFTDNGYLDKVVVDDYIFIFRNFNREKVDIGVIYPDGKIEILREVETGYNWDNLNLLSGRVKATESRSDLIRWTGRIVARVPCAIAAAKAIVSHGILLPGALLKLSFRPSC